MPSWEIQIQGIVQGVGFRPKVYQLARKQDICGEVSNGSSGLHIYFNASEQEAQDFYALILAQKPPLARIQHSVMQATEQRFFDKFGIIESEDHGPTTTFFAPDYAICTSCQQELFDPHNRRYQYPFITCTQCGPRYSIISGLPYDRPYTSMHPFKMCAPCETEYHNPLDRRHYSQTNSCPDCGIEMKLYAFGERQILETKTKDIIDALCKAWEAGEIVAIKGIGGFLLCCDPAHEVAISRLRLLKARPAKPFALMVPPDYIIPGEARLSPEIAPIQLVPRQNHFHNEEAITGGLDQIGLMKPYTPLFALLLAQYQKAIIATSANRGSAPICFEKETELAELADLVLTNNRPILTPQDDSVVRFSQRHADPIIIRRSRGLAPSFFYEGPALPNDCILAMGADLKSSFCLLHEGQIYISQYLGNLTQNAKHVSQHFIKLLLGVVVREVAEILANVNLPFV
ncbi:MAG: Sua5/YciO/YrdC/YwlC family protein, partial [Bacteroidota bacterium]